MSGGDIPWTEFDGVDFFVHEPGRPSPPPPKLGMYLDSWLSQAGLADRLPAVLADLLDVLDQTGQGRLLPNVAGYTLAGEATVTQDWQGDGTTNWLAAGLKTGRVETATVILNTPAGDDYRYWSLECWCLPERSDSAVQMSLVPSDNLWPAEDTDAVADRLLDLLRTWQSTVDLRAGCVTYDRVVPRVTPWERWYGVDHQLTAPLTRTQTRGYYWANLLTAGHLERLGQPALGDDLLLDRIGPDAAVLRAAGPITSWHDDGLAAMKAALGPVLIPRAYQLYEGWPLRIIPDPGTAFRKVPPGSPRPHLVPPR